MPVLVNAKTYALGDPAVIGILVLETKDDAVVLGINERGADRLIQSLHRFLAGEAERMPLKPPKSD